MTQQVFVALAMCQIRSSNMGSSSCNHFQVEKRTQTLWPTCKGDEKACDFPWQQVHARCHQAGCPFPEYKGPSHFSTSEWKWRCKITARPTPWASSIPFTDPWVGGGICRPEWGPLAPECFTRFSCYIPALNSDNLFVFFKNKKQWADVKPRKSR